MENYIQTTLYIEYEIAYILSNLENIIRYKEFNKIKKQQMQKNFIIFTTKNNNNNMNEILKSKNISKKITKEIKITKNNVWISNNKILKKNKTPQKNKNACDVHKKWKKRCPISCIHRD